MFEDLGVQMNRDSTLVSYVEKLVWLLTGNFGKRGAQYVPSSLVPLGRDRGHAAGEGPRSPVAGAPIISGLVPCNVIAEEILTDHPARYRAMLVESANPAHSLADSARMREALRALELVVVIDVAMTETARLADYVLPAPTQFEKFEATFFNFDFPRNVFHLRHPVVPAPDGVLPEPEIHARLVEAAGALTEEDYAPLRAAAARGRARVRPGFPGACWRIRRSGGWRRSCCTARSARRCRTTPRRPPCCGRPRTSARARTRPGSAAPATATGLEAGERLFDAIVDSPHGLEITHDDYEASWQRLPGDRIHLDVPELLAAVAALRDRPAPHPDPNWPFVLSAGERRAFTANTIMRDPTWRRRDPDGRLRMSVTDATRLGVAAGDRVRLTTRRGSTEVAVDPTDAMQPGHISLPNGLGLTGHRAHRRRPERAHRRRRPRRMGRHTVAQTRTSQAGSTLSSVPDRQDEPGGGDPEDAAEQDAAEAVEQQAHRGLAEVAVQERERGGDAAGPVGVAEWAQHTCRRPAERRSPPPATGPPARTRRRARSRRPCPPPRRPPAAGSCARRHPGPGCRCRRRTR